MAENKWQPNWTAEPGGSPQLSDAGPQKLASEKTLGGNKTFDAGTAAGFANLVGEGGPWNPEAQMRSMQKGADHGTKGEDGP